MEIDLADAVAALRDELLEAAARNSGTDIAFEVGPIVLDFEVELRDERAAGGSLKAWVLSADSKRSSAQATTHRVTLTLTPRSAANGPLLVAGEARDTDGPGRPGTRIGR